MNEFDEEIDELEEKELYEHFRLVVDKGQSMLRIDKFLMNRIENASRTKIQAAADAGSILVNEKPVKSSYKIKPLDVISIVMATPPKDTEVVPEDIPLDIVYEDDDLLLVNKKAGMVVHPGYNNARGTLVNALAFYLQDNPFMKEKNIRPGLVHRIDKNTSGLLIIAKNEVAMTNLAKQFFDHSIQRRYQALVWGDLKEDEGTISGYIGRSLRDRRIFQLSKDENKGKWSVTHYKVIERFQNATLIECRLETGRTHQIRVHLRSIGHPLFADDSYGGAEIVCGPPGSSFKHFIMNCFEIMPRQGLHAKSLGFNHPKTKTDFYFESDLPEDMQTVIERFRKYAHFHQEQE